MPYSRLVFRTHAIKRMFEQHISYGDVERVVNKWRVIAEYPRDEPFPSMLVLGWINQRPLHVVAADDHENKQTIVITVYEPDTTQWKEGFTERKIP